MFILIKDVWVSGGESQERTLWPFSLSLCLLWWHISYLGQWTSPSQMCVMVYHDDWGMGQLRSCDGCHTAWITSKREWWCISRSQIETWKWTLSYSLGYYIRPTPNLQYPLLSHPWFIFYAGGWMHKHAPTNTLKQSNSQTLNEEWRMKNEEWRMKNELEAAEVVQSLSTRWSNTHTLPQCKWPQSKRVHIPLTQCKCDYGTDMRKVSSSNARTGESFPCRSFVVQIHTKKYQIGKLSPQFDPAFPVTSSPSLSVCVWSRRWLFCSFFVFFESDIFFWTNSS